MKKILLTESERQKLITEREQAIINSFTKTFNTIKRIDENDGQDYEAASRGVEYGINPYQDQPEMEYDFIKSAIESASGDKVEKRGMGDNDRPLYSSLSNEYVTYYIGSEEQIILNNAKTGERYPIGELKHYDTPMDEASVGPEGGLESFQGPNDDENEAEIQNRLDNINKELEKLRNNAHKENPRAAQVTDFLMQHDRKLKELYNKMKNETGEDVDYIDFVTYIYNKAQSLVFDPSMNETSDDFDISETPDYLK